jgi:hypothetical protein
VSGTRAAPVAWRLQDPAGVDAACLALVTILSALPYLFHLGFYSDDWGLLALFSERSTSVATLIQDFVERPIQGVYLLLLFKSFGLHPLGYHIVNTLVLAASASLLFLLLIRIGLGRAGSFATTLIFVMLPQLSTVRVWYAAFQIPLALLLSLVSMHCQLSFARAGRIGWLAAAIVSAVLSIGAYEIFAPLMAGFAVVLAGTKRRRTTRHPWILAGLVLTTIIAGVVYKLAVSGRTGSVADPNRYLLGLRQLFRLDYDWRLDSSLNIVATPRAYFWAPVEGWWTGARTLFTGGAGLGTVVIAILVAGVTWLRLEMGKSAAQLPPPKRLLVIGLATFLLGNATFLIVPAVVFTSTGMGNRVHLAAAIGVAMIFAALITFVASAADERRRRHVFAALIAVTSALAFVRLATIERYWVRAPALQESVLAAARADLRDLPPQSTVILDGVCPYHGPAVVFEEAWDFGGALTLALGRPMWGDTVSPRMSVTPKGLATSIYNQASLYPYGPQLYVYNPIRHLLVRLTDSRAAARYFAAREPSHCPRGFVARGVEV